MRILVYNDFHPGRHRAEVDRVTELLRQDELQAADLKKLSPTEYYRAKLSRADRLLLKVMSHDGERCALLLEVIENHEYGRSRFLRGARIEEEKIPPLSRAELERESPPLAYVNPAGTRFHLLDKPLSFDEAQEAVYALPSPLIVIGPAGSGKTAITLERMKLAQGDVLYVTRSAYLAEHASRLYFSHGYENEHQQAEFLSLREYLETLAPVGKEVRYPLFRGWLERHRQQLKGVADAHRLFEEFQGVLTGGPVDKPHLSRDEYLGLGVRQSAFPAEVRETVFSLFEKYLAWLEEARLSDPNLIAHTLLPKIEPRYDFLVIDEAQDLTNIQLAAVLASLRKREHFLLCGDSNQIVHPNFFSWSAIKSLFYHDERTDAAKAIRILHANYRNSPQVTEIANRLLKVKQRRFGSIDRESNYLMQSAGGRAGEVSFLRDGSAVRKELDEKTRASAHVAVIVIRDEDKPAARESFHTPLLFSVHEAKGLEYESVILWNFVSGERKSFAEVAEGVLPADLEGDELRYARARDKADKSLESYKFFVNSLYVALTRAVKNLYLVESDSAHPLLALLGVSLSEQLKVARQRSSTEEWQREARRLELQGRNEQAEAIRRGVLRERPVPWEVLDLENTAALAAQALDPKCVSNKARERLFECAVMNGDRSLAWSLRAAGFGPAADFDAATRGIERKFLAAYEAKNIKSVLALTEEHGVDFRNPVGLTPLMLAVRAGNTPLAEALLERGADPLARDNFGATALQHALSRAYRDAAFATTSLSPLYALLAPGSLALRIEDRLVKLERPMGEYFLLYSFLALYRPKLMRALQSFEEQCAQLATAPAHIARTWRSHALTGLLSGRTLGLQTSDFIPELGDFPDDVVRPERRRRQYLSHLFSKNEAGRDSAYNRRLFVRTHHGHYGLNPTLEVMVGEEEWVRMYDLIAPPALRAHGTEGWRRLAERLAGDSSAQGKGVGPAQAPAQSQPSAPSRPAGRVRRIRSAKPEQLPLLTVPDPKKDRR